MVYSFQSSPKLINVQRPKHKKESFDLQYYYCITFSTFSLLPMLSASFVELAISLKFNSEWKGLGLADLKPGQVFTGRHLEIAQP